MKISSRFLRLILLLGSVAIPGFFAARNLASWPARLGYPGELDFVESTVLAEMVHLREGIPIYARASVPRFDAVLYGPEFYLLCSHLMNPQRPGYFRLRAVSSVATLMLAAGCALLAYWLARSYLSTVVSSLLFLSYSFVSGFGTQARCDVMSLLLWFSGFLVAYRFQKSRRILLAVPLMTLGFYYKQQFVAAPLAVLFFLLLEKRFRLAAEFTALLGATGLTFLAIFQFLVFRHQAFLLHFFAYNVIPFSWQEGFRWAVILGITFLVPSAVAIQFLRAHPDRLLACYFGCLVFLLPLMMAKKASNLNYAIELPLVLCPLFTGQLITSMPRPSRAAGYLCLLAVTLWLGNIFPVWSPQAKDFAQDNAVQAFLRENFPPRAPALGHYAGDLVRAGLDTPISDFYQYTWLACGGTVSDQILLTPLREQRYAVILLRFDLQAERNNGQPAGLCLPEQLYDAITQNYRPLTGAAATLLEARHYYGWVPRSWPLH